MHFSDRIHGVDMGNGNTVHKVGKVMDTRLLVWQNRCLLCGLLAKELFAMGGVLWTGFKPSRCYERCDCNAGSSVYNLSGCAHFAFD